MKKIIAILLTAIMVTSLFSMTAIAAEDAADSPKDYQDYLWELTADMSDEDFALYSLRNYKIIQSVEPLLDAASFKTLYKANVHLKQKAEGSKEEFIEAQNNIIMYTSMADGVYFLWDADNIPYDPADAELTDEELDAAPLDGVGFIPLMVKYLLDDPSQAKGNIIMLAGGAGNNRSNSGESYPAAEVFNDLGYNCFVLQYRIAPYTAADRFMDTQRAIRLVKYYAEQEGWGGQDMIAAAGWSAGAMTICGTINNCYGELTPADVYDPSYVPDEIDAINSDLDVAMPIYGGGIREDCENPHIPAIYTAVGSEDNVVGVEGEQAMYDLVVSKGIPAQIHIFEGAGHGFGVGQEGALKSTDEVKVWPEEADAFMQENLGFNSGK